MSGASPARAGKVRRTGQPAGPCGGGLPLPVQGRRHRPDRPLAARGEAVAAIGPELGAARVQPGHRPGVRCGIVLGVQEDACQVAAEGRVVSVRYASQFPAPRKERVSPGHLVAVAEIPGGAEAVVWRWYDAVVIGDEAGAVRLWEPAHGEVAAQPRSPRQRHEPGTRAYLSAGLPGAGWWVAGRAVDRAEDADVELDEVERLYTEHGMWDSAFDL